MLRFIGTNPASESFARTTRSLQQQEALDRQAALQRIQMGTEMAAAPLRLRQLGLQGDIAQQQLDTARQIDPQRVRMIGTQADQAQFNYDSSQQEQPFRQQRVEAQARAANSDATVSERTVDSRISRAGSDADSAAANARRANSLANDAANQRKDRAITDLFGAIKTGDFARADAIREQFKLDPGLSTTGAEIEYFGKIAAAEAAKRYPVDKQTTDAGVARMVQAQKDFISRYMAAVEADYAAGRRPAAFLPQTLEGAPAPSRAMPPPQAPRPVQLEGGNIGIMDTNSGQITDTGQRGQVPGRFGTGGTSGGGSGSVYRQKYDLWLKTYPGDTSGALNYAGGRMLTDQQLTDMASRIVAREFQGQLVPPPVEQRRTRTQQVFEELKALNAPAQPEQGNGQPQAAGQQPAAAPADQQYPVPQTDDDFNSLPSGAVYRDPDDGQLYRKP